MKYLVVLITLSLVFFSFKEKTSKKDTYTKSVAIVNTHWNNMYLEVRAGNYGYAEDNALIWSGNLKRGERVNVQYDVFCFYRRSANPDNQDGRMTYWTSTGCFNNSPCTVDNP